MDMLFFYYGYAISPTKILYQMCSPLGFVLHPIFFSAKSTKICQIHSAVSPVYLPHETPCSSHINRLSGPYVEDRMATSFSNMNLTNPLKGLVSKRRYRYKKDGFNLDLTCILFTLRNHSFNQKKIFF